VFSKQTAGTLWIVRGNEQGKVDGTAIKVNKRKKKFFVKLELG
jgi:hypothetical protein